jgi:glycosyltransferase involved in cell wall biosynthesis
VGDGPSRRSLERRFAGTPTVFTGYLTGHDLACAYASSDVFVFPAANETLGNVVLEAMASRLPVVAPRSGGVLDVITDGRTGLLFDPESKAASVACVKRLLQDRDFARTLGEAGRTYAEGRSWRRVLDDLIDDYLTLIGQDEPETIPWQVRGRRSLARDAVRPGE